jgi:hypothetical protein
MADENSESAPESEPEGVPEPSDTGLTDPAAAAGLLSEMLSLRRRARSARHAYWFPLVLFGVLTCAAVPLYTMPIDVAGKSSFAGLHGYMPVLGGVSLLPVGTYLGYYWLVALLGGLALTLLWYRRHARRSGLKTPARGYLITVTALTALALFLPALAQLPPLHFLFRLFPGPFTNRGMVPFLIIAAGLCVLAWAERSRALGVIAAVYTGSALLGGLYNIENALFRLGWHPTPYELATQWRLASLPNVLLPALVLLIGGAGAFVVQRRQRRAI